MIRVITTVARHTTINRSDNIGNKMLLSLLRCLLAATKLKIVPPIVPIIKNMTVGRKDNAIGAIKRRPM